MTDDLCHSKDIACKVCGSCCKNITQVYDNNDDTRAWIKVRRFKIIDSCEKYILVLVKHRCPELTQDNKCRLHGSKKPLVCKTFPDINTVRKYRELGLDLLKALGKDCPFRKVEL